MPTRIFVSHASADERLAGRFVRALEAGIEIGSNEIRCTSLTDYDLPLGASVSSTIRKEIEKADVVVGLLTPKSLASRYVLFELGAAWGKGKTTFPLLAKGVGMNRLPVLMKELSVGHLSNAAGVERVLRDLAGALGVKLRPTNNANYREAIAWLVRVAQKPKKKKGP